MAPKTRHLAQGKRRKRPNRRAESNVAARQTRPSDPAGATPTPFDVTAIDRPGEAADIEETVGFQPPASEAARRRTTAGRATRPYQVRNRPKVSIDSDAQRSNALPREVEYAYIRSDMRRLLLTAGTLTIVMMVLLFVIER